MIFIIMGVSGTGKTTIGKLLATHIGCRFDDADDFHPIKNIEKMASGQPLNDADRAPWLMGLNQHLQKMSQQQKSVVLGCSALKKTYREQLSIGLDTVFFIHLMGSFELLYSRMAARKNHFMSESMLKSQFDTLEPCLSAYKVDVKYTPQQILGQIVDHFNLVQQYQSQSLVEGLMFPEAPRWHQGRCWFTDQHAQQIITTDLQGHTEIVAETDDLPGGLGWLPDGTLLVVYMKQRQLYQFKADTLSLYADLSQQASFHCNDMIVDEEGNAWVGNFGYDLAAGDAIKSAEIVHVNTKQAVKIAADQVIFPNGCVLSEDGLTLVVAETFANRLTQFAVASDGTLSQRQLWADLKDAHPDGICWSNDDNLWVAAPNKGEVLKVAKGGAILAKIKTIADPYACMLGGEQNNVLFIASSGTSDPQQAKLDKSGRIEICELSSANIT